MAYRIRIDGTTVYDQRNPDKAYQVIDPTWTQEVNKADSLVFTIPYGGHGYDAPIPMTSEVVLWEDGTIIFRGRVLKCKRTMYGDKIVTCEGDLGWLNDSIVRPCKWTGRDLEFIRWILSNHNSQVEASRRIFPADTTASGTTDIKIELEDYEDSLSLLTENWRHEITSASGQSVSRLVMRWEESNGQITSYLGWSASGASLLSGEVQLGKNLLDISHMINGEDVYTVIVPLGASVDTDETDSEGNTIKRPLTIASVNDGKDYLTASASVLSQYGKIWRTVNFSEIGPDDDTTEAQAAQQLKEAGQKELDQNLTAAVTLEASAIDLSKCGYNVRSFRLGDFHRVKHQLLGIDEDFVLQKIELKLDRIERSRYRFGRERKALTDQV